MAIFGRVTLPLIAPGILAGAVMGFAKAMGEFGATITFVANIPGQTQTLPSAIWARLQMPGGEGSGHRDGDDGLRRRHGRRAAVGSAGAARGREDCGRMTLSVRYPPPLWRLSLWM